MNTEPMRLSPSIAHIMLTRSPWHAWQHHRLGGGMTSEATDATRRGNLVETLLLGGGKDIVVVDAKDWRTKVAQETRAGAEQMGKVAVLAEKYEEAKMQADVLRDKLDPQICAPTVDRQLCLDWTSDDVECRARLDLLCERSRDIWDLKTVENAGDEAVAKSIASYGGDIQAAAYVEAAESNFSNRGLWRFQFIHVEPDYGVAVVRPLSEAYMELGRRKWARAKRIWQQCIKVGMWPTYGITPIEPLAWHLSADLAQEIKVGEMP